MHGKSALPGLWEVKGQVGLCPRSRQTNSLAAMCLLGAEFQVPLLVLKTFPTSSGLLAEWSGHTAGAPPLTIKSSAPNGDKKLNDQSSSQESQTPPEPAAERHNAASWK